MKKIVAFMLCIASLLLSSCEANENIDFMEENGVWYLLYHNERYYEAPLFMVTEHSPYYTAEENDIELGWHYSFPFSSSAYSDTSKNPLFIYTVGNGASLYFRQDYDYQTDTFAIENTTAEIVWENIFDSKQNIPYGASKAITSVTLRSKQNARIRSIIEILLVDNQWYVSVFSSFEVWTPSAEFLEILTENVIITT